MVDKKTEAIKHDRTKNATYLPSISNMYVATLANDNVNREVKCLGKNINEVKQRLNHLTKKGIFYYPYALYSAGHAKEYEESKCMITQRDPDVFILGDSGGYQFGTGANEYPWDDKAAQKEIQLETMRWLEKNCHASMTLDLPPWIATRNKKAMKAGLTTYEKCRDATLESLETFFRNRTPGATEFLNVLQGETEGEILDWYNSVIKYSDPKYWNTEEEKSRVFEGFAFAGRQSYCMYTILKTVRRLLDDGHLHRNGRIILHFLGSGKLNSATAFSRLQTELRKITKSDIMITFDAASPYLSAASGKVYSDIVINSKEVTFKYNSLPSTYRRDPILPGNENNYIGRIKPAEPGTPPTDDGKRGKKAKPARALNFDLVGPCDIYEGYEKNKDLTKFKKNKHKGKDGKDSFGGGLMESPVWLREKGGDSGGAKINGEPLEWTNSPVVKKIKYKDIYVAVEKTISEKSPKTENGKIVYEADKKGKLREVVTESLRDRYTDIQIDSLAYVIAMAHNVYIHIEGIRQINELFNNKEWRKLPPKYEKMDDDIQKVFNLSTEEAITYIEKHKLGDYGLLKFTGKGRKQQALTKSNFNEQKNSSNGVLTQKNGKDNNL